MKALILVGGYGTRLRPLTFSCPKSVVELGNKPIIAHQIESLVKVGVKEVILAIAYQPRLIIDYVQQFEKEYNIKITLSEETEPLGTAGPIKLAQEIIKRDNTDELLFVFNSDIICEFPLEKLLNFHKQHGKQGTILLTQVQDPSKYGVVVYNEDGQINQFVEKPQNFISDKINAGLYLFNISMIDRIPNRPCSIEREIFPKMAQDNQLFAQQMEGFWMDVGQPKDYLSGSYLYLNHLRQSQDLLLAQGSNIIGNVLIHKNTKVEEDTSIGPDVIIGEGCTIQRGVRLQKTVLLNNVHVKENSWISDSIIGWKSTIGKWVRIEGTSVIGENVQIKDEIYLNGTIILPHKAINQSCYQKNEILM